MFIADDLTQAMYVLANDPDFVVFGKDTEMAKKAREAKRDLEKLEREVKEEEKRMEEEDKVAKTDKKRVRRKERGKEGVKTTSSYTRKHSRV